MPGLLFEEIADFGEELDVGRRGWRRGFGFLFFHESHEFVGRFDDDEEDDGGGDEEADGGVDDKADIEDAEFEGDIGVGATGGELDDGFDNAFGEGGDDAAEGCADDDAGGEVDDVAFEDELFEFVEHGVGVVFGVWCLVFGPVPLVKGDDFVG